MKKLHTIPAQLWTGDRTTVNEKIECYLQELFCNHEKNEECSCKECTHIKAHQHPSIMWLSPEKQYSVNDIEQIVHTTSFALEKDQIFFFVLDKCETLTGACSNKLLKTLEEPPRGYNFILNATNADLILPTIRSRCIIKTIAQSQAETNHPLLKHFTSSTLDPFEFERDLKTAAPTEHDTRIIIDSFLAFFCTKRIQKEESSYYDNVIKYIEKKGKYLPQPGSAILFWKNFYLNFPRTHSS